MNGYSDDQIIELRQGKASFDVKLDALVKLAKNTTENHGNTDASVLENYFNAGWTKEKCPIIAINRQLLGVFD